MNGSNEENVLLSAEEAAEKIMRWETEETEQNQEQAPEWEEEPTAEDAAADLTETDAQEPWDDSADPEQEIREEADVLYSEWQEEPPARRRKARLPLLLAAVLAAASLFGFFWFYHKDTVLLSEETCYAAEAGGVILDGMTREEAEAALSAAWPDAELEKTVRCTLACAEEGENDTLLVDYTCFSPHYDRQSALDAAWKVGREGTRRERLAAIRAAQEERPVFEVTRQIDEDAIRAFADELAASLDREMQEASITVDPETDGVHHLFAETDGVDGRKLDREKLTALLLEAPDNGFSSIELPVEVEEMPATLEELRSHTQLIRTFTTKHAYLPDRVFNIHRAADAICGTVLAPGETFSFNGTVGNTSLAENGYREWHVIVGGKDAMDRGGGVCQAATTLYNAAIRCGFEILAREPHAIASDYVPKGQDAAIAYGNCDLKFRNNTDYPVYLFCHYDNTSITFDIYGDPLPNDEKIELESEIIGVRSPGDPVITYDASRPKGSRETTVSALNGYDVKVYRIRLDASGKEISREVDHTDAYPTRRAEIIEGTKEVPVPTPEPEPEEPTVPEETE